MSTDQTDATYPDFVTEGDRYAWEVLSPEDKRMYLEACPISGRSAPERSSPSS